MTQQFWRSVVIGLCLPVLGHGQVHAETKGEAALRICYVKVQNELRRTQLKIDAEYRKALIDCESNGTCARNARRKQAQQLNQARKKEIDDALKCRLASIVDVR